MLRARAAGLDAGLRLDTWDRQRRCASTSSAERADQPAVPRRPPRRLATGAGRGRQTHLATALGHIAVRRRVGVHMLRADKLFKRLEAARLDNSVEAEMRRLAHTPLLIIDDFCLQPLDATETADFYEIVVERHHKAGHHRHVQLGTHPLLPLPSLEQVPRRVQPHVLRSSSTATGTSMRPG